MESHRPELARRYLARGDRRLAPVLMEPQRRGRRFDAWTEHAKMSDWHQALSACDLREDFYLRERREEELLPWDHLDVGVSNEYLLAEQHYAWRPCKLQIAARWVASIAASAIGLRCSLKPAASCQNPGISPFTSPPRLSKLPVIVCTIASWVMPNG